MAFRVYGKEEHIQVVRVYKTRAPALQLAKRLKEAEVYDITNNRVIYESPKPFWETIEKETTDEEAVF